MTLWAIAIAVSAFATVIILAVVWGGGRMREKLDAADARAEANTYRKATEAKDAIDDLSDDVVLERLRQRAGQ